MKKAVIEAIATTAFFFFMVFGWPVFSNILEHLSLQIPAAVALCAFTLVSAVIIATHSAAPAAEPIRENIQDYQA